MIQIFKMATLINILLCCVYLQGGTAQAYKQGTMIASATVMAGFYFTLLHFKPTSASNNWLTKNEEMTKILERIDNIIQQTESEQPQDYYPKFLKMLVTLWKLSAANEMMPYHPNQLNKIEDIQNEYEPPYEIQPLGSFSELPRTTMVLLQTLLNLEEAKHKRYQNKNEQSRNVGLISKGIPSKMRGKLSSC